ncbi:MAG: 50S ribosomal protein L11 methyltransferase [Desulfomonilaceae bacterium]|nr:50S ribosomal protein L11 methyltransferase [Desulfomonilaceae bacterium]
MAGRSRKHNKNTDRWWMGKVRSLDVGERLRLIPFWERGSVASDRTPLIVDPGPAFGAGDHPTTIMALELLEEAVIEKTRTGCAPTLLDVGTGTGVLAVAGRILGTGFTVGLDIDPVSVCTARRNAGLNGFDRPDAGSRHIIDFVVGGADCIGGRFHIVTVNLVAPVLLRIRDDLIDRAGHTLILSGIADVMADEVFTAYGSGDLAVSRIESREGWNAATFHTNSPCDPVPNAA